MSSSKTLFYLCIAFIVGIASASLIKIPQVFSWGIFVLGTLIIVICLILERFIQSETIGIFNINKNRFLSLSCKIGFFILFFVMGIMRFQIFEFNVENNELRKLNNSPQNISLTGQIIGEPDVRDNFQRLRVATEKITFENQEFNIKGKVLVTLPSYNNTYFYLDTVKLTGKLKEPGDFNGFSYKNYLRNMGIYSVMDFPEVELVFREHNYNIFNFTYEKILFVKAKLIKSIDQISFAPESFILKGIVFGDDKNMPKDLKEEFNATGLSHLTAVSGSNIVILISVVMSFLLFLGFWRGQAFYFSIIFIWIYIVLIGFPASAIRAAIMGSISLLAQKLGRQNTSSRVILLAGSIMLFLNPFLLLYDISFQLSFLASMGIIHLKPLVDLILYKPFVRKGKDDYELKIAQHFGLKSFLDIISVTIAAQIFTLPIIVYNFGSISLVSPLTNLLVLPIIPLLTILGFLVAILGSMFYILGSIFYLPCWFLLMYFLKILEIFSKPWAVKTFQDVWWLWVALYYIVFVMLIWYLNKFKKPKFLGF